MLWLRRATTLTVVSLAVTTGALVAAPHHARAAVAAYVPAPAYRQQHALSCESAALHIALAARGIDVDENWLQGQYTTDLRAPIVSGGQVVTWGDPYTSFVGNVDGHMASTGYGVYESRVVVAAHRAGVRAWAGEGWNPADLYAELALGNPVVVWVPWSLEPPTVRTISTFDGHTVWFSGQEHAQTLIGFDSTAGTVTLDDPLSGSIRSFSMALFEQRFAQFHGDAVVVGGSDAAPVIGVRGTDSALWVNHGGGWAPYGGLLAAAPATVREDDGTVLVVVTGSDHALWIRGDTFDWRRLSGATTDCLSGPGAAFSGGELVVACEGSDHALWVGQAVVSPGVVPVIPGFASLQGTPSGAPAVAFVAGRPVYMITVPPPPTPTPTPKPTPTPSGSAPGQPAPGAVWIRTDSSGWTVSPFSCVDSPALTAQDGLVLFTCHGSGDALWYGMAAAAVPTGARTAGGVVRFGVGAAPVQNGFAVDVQGSDGGVWETRIVDGAAESWTPLGGHAVGAVSAG